MIWFILFITVIIVACFVVYKSAEVHELHKMRAAFEDKRHDIDEVKEVVDNILELYRNDDSIRLIQIS